MQVVSTRQCEPWEIRSPVLHSESDKPRFNHARTMLDKLRGIEERYDIEAVSSPSGVTHLTLTRR